MSFPFTFLGRAAQVCRGLSLLLFALGSRPALAQVYYLDLSKQPLELPGRAISVEQVLDGRPGKLASVGTIYKGLNDDKAATVLFRQSLETELTAWLGKQLPARPTDQPVVLCVRQLLVNETVTATALTSNTISSTELALDIYAHRPGGYHFVRNVAAHSNKPGIAINSDHASYVAQLMQQCLAALTPADLAAAAQRPARTLAQALAATPVARPAVLRAAAPRRGVYFSAEQFVNNQPDTTAQLRLDTVRWSAVRSSLLDANVPRQYLTPYGPRGYSRPVVDSPSGWKGTVLLKGKVRTGGGDHVAQREIWGFSDGRQAYVRQANIFRLLTRQNDFFTFVGAAPLDVSAVNQLSGSVQRPRMPAGTGARIDPNNGSGEPMVFALSLRTGQFSAFPPPGQPQRADTAFIYVYRPLGGPAEAQPLLFNDRQVGQLRPGEYLELPWPHLGQTVRLGTAGSAALVLVPSTSVANYVRLRPGANLTTWQVVPPKQGEAEVDALEKPRP